MSEKQARHLAELLTDRQKRDLLLLAAILLKEHSLQRRAG